jgi:hypothetical protein
MTTRQIPVSKFKATCTALLREMSARPQRWLITNRGRVIAVVTSPEAEKQPDPREWVGSLRGTVTYQAGWDQPEDPGLWEASR